MKRTYIRSAVGFVLVYAAMALFTGTPRHASAREQTRTVTARVVNASGSGAGIRAERVPGQFTVPEGYVATNFKYHFQDPATGYTSTRLGPSSIYSVTHGRSVREAAANPGFELPPGKYKFVVGGRPGAYGSLSFRLVSTTSESDQVTSLENGQTRRSPEKAHGTFDATYYPMTDVYVSDGDGFKQLKDFEGIEVWNWPSQVVVRFRNGQATSKFALRISGDGYEHTHTSTLIGTLSDGRFTGTETGVTQCQTTVADKPITYKTGTVWTLSGQVDPNGLLVLHGKWQSDFGEIPDIKVDGNGGVQVGTKPNESCAESRSLRTQLHLRLPIGQSPSSRTTTPGIVSQPPATPESPPVWADPVDTDDSRDSIWDNTANDDSRDVVSRPPDVPADDRDQRNEVWNSDNDPGSIGSDHNDTTTGQPSDSQDRDEQEDPKIGDRLPEGKIWFRPPWDEGGAYPMDEREVRDIRERQAQGLSLG